jgi:hypothetical protein
VSALVLCALSVILGVASVWGSLNYYLLPFTAYLGILWGVTAGIWFCIGLRVVAGQ